MGKKPIEFKFECSACGGTEKDHGSFLSEEETTCPLCGSSDITKKPKPRRGRPPKNKEHISVDLFPKTVQLARDRADREGIPFCEAIDRSIVEANGPQAIKLERERLRDWRCLRFVAIRRMTEKEKEVFNELFYLAASKHSLPPDAFEDNSISTIKSRLADAQVIHGTPNVIADDYVIALCGLLSDRPGVASLWAFTLYDIYQQSNNQQTVTMDTWVRFFPEGVPTDQAIASVWQEQRVFFGKTTERNYTEMVEEWPK